MRVAVVDRLEAVEPALAPEVLDDRLGHVADVPPGQRPEAVEEDARSRRAARRPAGRATCRAGSPRHRSPGRCGRCPSPRPRRPPSTAPPDARTGRRVVRVAARRQFEPQPGRRRALVAPADHVGPGDLLDHLERALERRCERALAEPERLLALSDPDVPERRPDGRRHVRGQRPGRGRPDEQASPGRSSNGKRTVRPGSSRSW